MAQRNAVKERTCYGCEKDFKCTAAEIAQRAQTCAGAQGMVWLPDCGLESPILRGIAGEEQVTLA